MNFTNQPNPFSATAQAVAVDTGLRAYMLRVYNYMASALIITGLIAYFAGTSEAFLSLMISPEGGKTGLAWVVMFAPLAFVFGLSAGIHRLSEGAAQAAFWAFAATMGVSLYYVFAIYTGVSITRVFFITAITFGAMSIYGYTTKRDLTGLGSFLMMAVIGLIVASLVNIFLKSTALHYAVSFIGVLVFVGLTAYDTQRIKESYYAVVQSGYSVSKAAIIGALQLYLDFINLFVMLLQFFGERK